VTSLLFANKEKLREYQMSWRRLCKQKTAVCIFVLFVLFLLVCQSSVYTYMNNRMVKVNYLYLVLMLHFLFCGTVREMTFM